MRRNWTAKLQSLWNFSMKFYSDDGLQSHYIEILYLTNPGIVTYCQKVSFSLPEFIEHNFLFRKFNFVTKDGRIQL